MFNSSTNASEYFYTQRGPCMDLQLLPVGFARQLKKTANYVGRGRCGVTPGSAVSLTLAIIIGRKGSLAGSRTNVHGTCRAVVMLTHGRIAQAGAYAAGRSHQR